MKRRDFVAASIGASLSPTLGEARAAGTTILLPALNRAGLKPVGVFTGASAISVPLS